MCVLVTQSCLTENAWTIACKAPLSTEFFRQEYWSGLPFPSPRDPKIAYGFINEKSVVDGAIKFCGFCELLF